ncbi:MAG: pyridoxal-phosphate dependent enzyme [Candidatus Dependentiae bacterium]|nr:pyridoxal-phosphate dependent enzyme [Candidatus Dependentiae bacterium]
MMKNIRFCIFLYIGIVVINCAYAQIPLFKQFPQCKDLIPHISLGSFPTPIAPLKSLGAALNCNSLYIKRDDLTGKKTEEFQLYGGNKVRKLEFLLADALFNHQAKTIVTFGAAGSNHALATAIYAHELGLNAILMLKDQPNSAVVRHNLLLDSYYNAQLQWYPDNETRSSAANKLLKEDSKAYLIPTGGSNSIGSLGFVNAAFELADQIKTGQISEPDLIYIPIGSCGTAAGLLLGMQAANIRSHLICVIVEPEEKQDEFLKQIKKLFVEINENLHALDASFHLYDFPEDQLVLNKKFCGTSYGVLIPEAADAITSMQQTEQIRVEGTYSAKAIAAIIDDASSGALEEKTVLFWNTYCGIDFSHLFEENDYKQLPVEFQSYFEGAHTEVKNY